MEYVNRAIGFLEAHPYVALAVGIALLLLLLYKHPVIFFVCAVIAVVLYLVLTLSSVGVSGKERVIKKSMSPKERSLGISPRCAVDNRGKLA